MKTLSLSFAVLTLVLFQGTAEAVFNDIPGSYAIYHDSRFGSDVYVGVAFVGKDTLIARSYEPATKSELILRVSFVVAPDGNLELGKDLTVLRGEFGQSGSGGRLLPMLMNWGRTWFKTRAQTDANLEAEANTDDDYFYEYWIPVFELRKIADSQDRFELVTAGILKGTSDPQFFEFAGLPPSTDSDVFTISPGTAASPVIDGLKIPLDSNWKTTDNRIFRIQQKTQQDSAFFVETMNIANQGITSDQALVKLMIIGNQGSQLLAAGTRVFKTKDSYNCFIRQLDTTNNKVSIQESQIIDRSDGVVSIVSLASFESLYLANKDYFEKILY